MSNLFCLMLANEKVAEKINSLSAFFGTLSNEEAAIAGAIVGSVVTGALSVLVFISIFFFVLDIIFNWKIFNKMGEPGWKCIIPFYRDFVLWGKVWSGKKYLIYLVLSLVIYVFIEPFSKNISNKYNALKAAGETISTSSEMNVLGMQSLIIVAILLVLLVVFIIFDVKFVRRFARAFGYGGWFAIGLLFLPIIFTAIIAFGKSTYLGNQSETFTKI